MSSERRGPPSAAGFAAHHPQRQVFPVRFEGPRLGLLVEDIEGHCTVTKVNGEGGGRRLALSAP